MEAIEFVKAIRERVIENGNTTYQDLLDSTTNAKDPVWQEMLKIYGNLDDKSKDTLLQFFRMIQSNTVSQIFGILDGSSYLNESKATFILKTEDDESVINGDLQDLFLEMEEQ